MLLYYEEIAADICNTDAKRMFDKDRNEWVVLARYFCMIYRHKVLNMSQGNATQRYNKDRVDVIHALKMINIYIETKNERGKMYHEFLKKCKDKVDNLEDNDDFEKIEDVQIEISNLGFERYVDKLKREFDHLYIFLKEGTDEAQIKDSVLKFHRRIHELNYLYV